MVAIKDVAMYFCANYPHKHELSKTRLTKLVYLADWASVLQLGRQMTDISWYFDNYGPFVEDVIKTVEANRNIFNVDVTRNIYGNEKMVIELRKDVFFEEISLSKEDISILDQVIEETKALYWKPFLQYVYSTKPIAESDRYRQLDLVKIARGNVK